MSNTGVYTVGDTVELEADFSEQGDAVDPTTVTCTVTHPGDTTTSPAVTRDAAGVYRATIAPDAPGKWSYRFDGTGAHPAAAAKVFYVRA